MKACLELLCYLVTSLKWQKWEEFVVDDQITSLFSILLMIIRINANKGANMTVNALSMRLAIKLIESKNLISLGIDYNIKSVTSRFLEIEI